MTEARREILTVGHSTHDPDIFLRLLDANGIAMLADVRRYPASRRLPHFGRDPLGAFLATHGIEYAWLGDALGGRRHAARGSANAGWRVEGFRAYADHTGSDEFAAGLEELEGLASSSRTAFMCAEGDWRRCHRRLIADVLVARGWRVEHVLRDGRRERHELPPFAVVRENRMSYPAPQPELDLRD